MIERFSAGFVRPCLPLLCLLAGCGDGATHLSYTAPVVPLGISFSCDTEGIWTVSAGLATPVGTFGIGHSFGTRDEFSYIVLRDRTRGTDQVFKLASTGRVDLHVVGESRIGMQKEDSNVWVIETETVSGTIDIQVTPSTSTLARVAFGSGDPDIVLTANRELIVEYPGWFSRPTQVSLDSIQAVILYDRFISCEHFLTIHWKQGVDHEAVRIPIRNSREIDNNLSLLERSFVQLGGAPRIERHATIVSPLDRQTRGAAFGLALYAIAATWLAKKMSKVGPLVVFVYLPTASLLFLYVGHWAWLVTVAAFALGRLAKERPTINQMSPSESDRGELGLPRAPA